MPIKSSGAAAHFSGRSLTSNTSASPLRNLRGTCYAWCRAHSPVEHLKDTKGTLKQIPCKCLQLGGHVNGLSIREARRCLRLAEWRGKGERGKYGDGKKDSSRSPRGKLQNRTSVTGVTAGSSTAFPTWSVCVNSRDPTKPLGSGQGCYSHYTDQETEAALVPPISEPNLPASC